MQADNESFKRGAVKPIACLTEAWDLVRHDFWLLVGITFFGVLLGNLAWLFLWGPAVCGISYCFLRRERGQRVSFDMLFRGFDYFLPSLIATLIMFVPMVVLILGAYLLYVAGVISLFTAMPPPERGQGLDPEVIAIFVGLTFWYFLAVTTISALPEILFFFTYALIVDRGLSGTEASKVSIRAVFGNLLGVLGVWFIGQCLMIAGLLFCYVGLIFVLPIIMAMKTIAYRQVFEMEQEFMEEDLEPPALPGPIETAIQGAPSTAVSPREPDA